ncbi:unnamed protein product, partial [Heterotrigona itama]
LETRPWCDQAVSLHLTTDEEAAWSSRDWSFRPVRVIVGEIGEYFLHATQFSCLCSLCVNRFGPFPTWKPICERSDGKLEKKENTKEVRRTEILIRKFHLFDVPNVLFILDQFFSFHRKYISMFPFYENILDLQNNRMVLIFLRWYHTSSQAILETSVHKDAWHRGSQVGKKKARCWERRGSNIATDFGGHKLLQFRRKAHHDTCVLWYWNNA